MGYTIKQKIDICLMAESNPEMTQADLANWAREHYGTDKPPSQTTISRILSKKNELIALKEHEFRLIRRRKQTNPLLRKVLQEWVAQSVWDGIPITAPIIQFSAVSLWKTLPENLREGNGEFSHKWCTHFFSKMNINLSNIENELTRPGKVWTFDERYDLRQYLSSLNYRLSDIFTIDEFFLCYSLPLDRSFSEENSFIGATVMLGVNVDGSEKLEPLVVGNYENMICFDGKPISKVTDKYGVSYKSNRKSWLTATMFYDYLAVLDKRLSLTGRKIVILIDDSASHRIVNIRLVSITLIFTSSASAFLPMNWGIVEEFKILYRLQQYLAAIEVQRNAMNNLQPLSITQYDVTILSALQWIKRAWDSVSPERVLSCWKYSGVLDSLPALSSFVNVKKSYNKLKEIIDQLEVNEKWDINGLLNLQREKKNKYYVSSDEIIESCIVDEWEPSIKSENLSFLGIGTDVLNDNDGDDIDNEVDNLNETLFADPLNNMNFDEDNDGKSGNVPISMAYPTNSPRNDVSMFEDYEITGSSSQSRMTQSMQQTPQQNPIDHFNMGYLPQQQQQVVSDPSLPQLNDQLNSENLRKHGMTSDIDIPAFKFQKVYQDHAIGGFTDVNSGISSVSQSSNGHELLNHNNPMLLDPKRKAALLSALIHSTESGQFNFTESTLSELKKVLGDNIDELRAGSEGVNNAIHNHTINNNNVNHINNNNVNHNNVNHNNVNHNNINNNDINNWNRQ